MLFIRLFIRSQISPTLLFSISCATLLTSFLASNLPCVWFFHPYAKSSYISPLLRILFQQACRSHLVRPLHHFCINLPRASRNRWVSRPTSCRPVSTYYEIPRVVPLFETSIHPHNPQSFAELFVACCQKFPKFICPVILALLTTMSILFSLSLSEIRSLKSHRTSNGWLLRLLKVVYCALHVYSFY